MPANCIRTTVKPDREELIVQIWIEGEPCSWLTFNAAQLDALIAVLVKDRKELRPLPDPNPTIAVSTEPPASTDSSR